MAARTMCVLLLACIAGGSTLLTTGCAGLPPSEGANRDLLEGLERRVLPNGLAVIVKEDHRLPTVTAMLAYRVGSVNEPPGLTGVSHYFEHMVFKGTRRYKRGDIDLVTYRCGGENNAYTTHDMTGYWFHVHSAHLDDVLDILADTMGNCSLDKEEFERERGPVLQEMNIWLDGPWGELERTLEKTIYTQSRYRHPVLGWREDVEKLTPEKMREYYKTYYRPNNASLIIMGDVRKEDAYRRAGKFFGAIPRGEDAGGAAWAEPAQEAERNFELKTGLASDRFILAYRAEPAGTDTDIILDVIATLMGEGRTSRLQARLVDREDLAAEGNIEAFNYSRKHEGVFYVQVELALEAPVERGRDVVLEELEALRTRPVRERELRRAKNILRAKFAFDAESQYELASKIGYFEALGLPDYVRDYMNRVESVTPEQVMACAKKIFTPENRTVGVGRAKPKRTPRRQAGPTLTAPSLGPVTETVLDNGLTILVKQRSDVPVLSVQALVQAGQLFEPEEKAGLSELLGEMLDEGIEDDRGRRRNADQIASEIEFVGGQYSTGANGVAVKVLSEHADLALDLVRDVLRYPTFPKDRFERLRDDLLAEIESMDDDPGKVARRLFYEHAYRGHPYHRPTAGYAPAVEKLTREDVEAYYHRFYRPENTIIAVTGDIRPEQAVAEIRSRLGGWKGEGEWVAPGVPRAIRQREPRRVNHTFKSQQARIHLGHVGIERTHPDYPALRVMETILCSSPGFTNRLARRVRDVEGLAYDVSGTITGGAGVAAGPFQIALGVEAKDKDKALKLVLDELKKFIAEGPTAEEVADARRYLLASFVSSWETMDDLASYLLEVRRYGLGIDYATRYHKAVAAVTREEVMRVARAHLDPANLTVVVVGPVDKEGKLLEGEQDK